MTNNNRNKIEFNFLEILKNNLISNLDGSNRKYDTFSLNEKPSKKIILGTLCAMDPNELNKSTSVAINSISVSFLVKNLNKLEVTPRFSVFYSAPKTKQDVEQKEDAKNEVTPKEYERFYFQKQNFILSSDKKEVVIPIQAIREEISQKNNISLSDIPIWTPKLMMDIKQYIQDNKTYDLVTISFVNYTAPNPNYETTIFEVGIDVNLERELIPFNFEYKNEGFIEKDSINVQAINCAANYIKEEKIIKTSVYKEYISQKCEPKINLYSLSGEEISFNFDDLSKKDKKYSILDKVKIIFDEYIEHYSKIRPTNIQEGYGKFIHYEMNFIKIRNRYSDSLDLLKATPSADKAFELMQKSFSLSSKYNGWRLFQIVFIIICIGDIIKKKNYDVTELLHVDTGGGKSEAYFGLVVFCSFYDRLNGKLFGISAITKFPLRMLSIQQIQRIARLFIWAEEIRKEEKILGEPFAVAYFVGSSKDFPNQNKDILTELRNHTLPGKIIQTCPICKTGGVIQSINELDLTIIHKCVNKDCKKEFYLYYTDEEIYRKLPTFIISTVDKLAGVAFNRRFRNILGGSLCKCERGHGFIPSGDICQPSDKPCNNNGIKLNIPFSTGPTLMIQDEMHLIRDGFGTIDSHFETFLETLQKRFSGIGFKNIAMTATISGAEYQISQLYNKKTEIFPGQSPLGKGVDDFFFEFQKNTAHRICLGLRPNVRENRYAIRATFNGILEFIKDFETNMDRYAKILNISQDDLFEILKNYKSFLSYHGKKDDIQDMKYNMMHEKDGTKIDKNNPYSLLPKVLTGENSLDEIRNLINEIENQDTKNTKEINVVLATNIVSHGVDIEKWNIMCFQGIPRSTAEYIQALSRIGRQHPGLALIWFYPNRIRDLSTFSRFEEYNSNIEHHVEKVPILRWAKLGFHQTFNSIFCGAILNYFSEVLNKPLYKVEQVNEAFSSLENPENDENRRLLKELIEEAYCTFADPELAKYFLDNIPSEIEKRLNKLFNYNGPEKNNFPNALSDGPEPYFANQYGMRGIQSNLLLRLQENQMHFINGYHIGAQKNIGGENG